VKFGEAWLCYKQFDIFSLEVLEMIMSAIGISNKCSGEKASCEEELFNLLSFDYSHEVDSKYGTMRFGNGGENK